MSKLNLDVELELLTCTSCGIAFAMPEHFATGRRNDHRSFWCPNGHEQHFPQESPEEKLRGQLAAAQDRADTLRVQRDHLERSAAVTRGHMPRLKKRIAHGVCPCCQRTFKQLSSHMERMHPEYVEEHGVHNATKEN